ncbi:venom protease-like [Anopheles aquasalis]|uniref:venom protease-like n=1 Tax=Anopheles aquasalis TaxID=42839 RepID=UPI00215AD08D|nr:venom protease-like [Anopheles aquasalis]
MWCPGQIGLVLVILTLVLQVLCQDGQPCYNSNGASGVCRSITSCPSSFQLNINPFSLFGGSQRGCQNFLGIGSVCCSNGYQATTPPVSADNPVIRPQAPANAQTTQGSPRTTTPRANVGLECTDAKGRVVPCSSGVSTTPKQTTTQRTTTTAPTTTVRVTTIRTTTPIILQTRLSSEPKFDKPAVLPTLETGCGLSDVEHNRVVGGVPAALHGWPWMALVGYENSLGEVEFRCGGSLITDRHVLSAAHCILASLTTVRLGEHDLNNQTESAHVDVPVYKYLSHPSYDTFDGHSDLAILFLSETVQFNDAMKPICLPYSEPVRSKDFTDYNPFIAGWGRTAEIGFEATVLQELQIPILTNDECMQLYKKIGKLFTRKQFNDAVLCAGILEGGKDSCQGDSGGPLMLPYAINKKFHYFQIGIVSYGIGCARANLPGAYTRVATFVDWIIKQVTAS